MKPLYPEVKLERIYKIVPPECRVWKKEYESACSQVGKDFANLFMCHAHETVTIDMKDGNPPRKKFKKVYRCAFTAAKVKEAWRNARDLHPIKFADTIRAIMDAMETGVGLYQTGVPETFEQVIEDFRGCLESHARHSENAPDSDVSMTGYWVINNPMLVAGVAMVVESWAKEAVEDSIGEIMAGNAEGLKWAIENKMKENFHPFLEANIRHYWESVLKTLEKVGHEVKEVRPEKGGY